MEKLLVEERKPSSRIEYIDLMKGICIVLVVLEHCKLSFPQGSLIWSMFEHMRMPLYFFLSGLFFKEYTGFKDYFIRKSNKLLVPYIFFSLIYFLPDILLINFKHASKLLTPAYFNDLLFMPLNSPLWFLRCLFFTGCIYFVLHLVLKKFNLLLQIGIVLSLSFCAMNVYDYYLPEINKDKVFQFFAISKLFPALVALPFFWAGNLVYPYMKDFHKSKKYVFVGLIITVALAALFCKGAVDFNNMVFTNNFFFFYLGAISGIAAVWCLSFIMKKLIIISIFGRYSLIILGTHWATMNSLLKNGVTDVYVLCAITLGVMPVMIWFFRKYFPFCCAQKNFFELKGGKVLFLKHRIIGSLIKSRA